MKRSYRTKVLSATMAVVMAAGFPASGYAYRATVLSDAQLDRLCVGGFDFDLTAAYAFRAATVSQNNIAAIAAYSPNAIKINSVNETLIRSSADFVRANQKNLSFIFSKYGDIADTVINNSNYADVSHSVPAGTGSDPAPAGPDASAGMSWPSSEKVTSAIDEIFNNVSTAIQQVNLAAVLAPNGKIENVQVNNSNVANVNTEGNPAATDQTNIAIFLAGGPVVDSAIVNSNIANIIENASVAEDAALGAAASTTVPSAATQVFSTSNGRNHMSVSIDALTSQKNIIMVRSLLNNVKDSLNRQFIKNQILSLF